ncbi:hypothetical protein, partial [Streptomyces exfoliatus]|uniref:hypothetical protein n=1 Tax=Streptomyces exfoliatus TaxID=1905 RepID=UPI0004C8CBA0
MSVRRAVALALSATLGITGLAAVTAPAASAAADSPYEVKIAAPPLSTPPWVHLYGAGTGLQLWNGAEGYHWRNLSGGPAVAAPTCPEPVAYGDEAGCMGFSGNAAEATVHDYTTGVTQRRTGLEGHTWLRAFGSDRVVSHPDTNRTALHLLGIGETAPADLVVELPGADPARTWGPTVAAFDDTGAVIQYGAGDGFVTALLDFATGALRKLPAPPNGVLYDKMALSADWIVQYRLSGTVEAFVVSRKDAAATGQVVKLPNTDAGLVGRLGVTGGWIVGHYGDPSAPHPVKATPVTGGASRDLPVKAAADAEFSTAPDGRLYVVGGTDSAHWGVRRVSVDGTGAPVTESVLSVPPRTVQRGGLTLANGRVTTEHTDGDKRNIVRYDVSLTEPRTATQAWSCDAVGGTALNCPPTTAWTQDYGTRWLDTGDGRLVTLLTEDIPPFRGDPPCIGCVIKLQVTTTGSGGTTRTVPLDTTRKISPVRLLGASGRYVHFLATENYETRSVVADIETGKTWISGSTNQALWGTWLWTSSAANDTVSAIDLRSGATVATIDLGTECGTADFDVVGKWIYARCGDGASAVVYDREKKTSVRFQVPRSSQPRLGDGFVAHTAVGAEGDPLSVTDVRSGAPVVRTLGLVAPGLPNYDQGWTIDRFGGGVAFVDPQQAIHVVGLGGVTSRLTALDSAVPTSVNLKSGAWKPRWTLSKPGMWSLAFKHKATGKVARSLSGGEARGLVAPAWDGKDAAGKLVANGAYAWALTVKAADGQGADLAVSGVLSVTGGAAVWRDMSGDDGFGDLLVMDTAGLVSLYRGTGTGAVSARMAGSGAKFATSSVFVPVGDLNGDRCADVYVRVGDQLRA